MREIVLYPGESITIDDTVITAVPAPKAGFPQAAPNEIPGTSAPGIWPQCPVPTFPTIWCATKAEPEHA